MKVLDAPAVEVPDGAEHDDSSHDETRGSSLSIGEASLVAGRHESTLRRYLGAERFPNAHRGVGGEWRVPIADLLSAGLLPHSAQTDAPGFLAEIETEVERQRAENSELRRLLAAAGTLADERAERIRDLQLSLRMLLRTNPSARTIEPPEPSIHPFVWSGEITQVEASPL